jgi:hypothetical protein
MKFDKWIAIVAIVAIPAISSCRKSRSTSQNIAAQQKPPTAHVEPERTLSKDEQSCKVFVKKFYDWYVHSVWSGFCNQGHDAESCKKASEFASVDEMSIKQVLSPKLEKLFDDDRAAEAASNDDGVGYLEESDPYITGNGDPSSHYEVENVRVKDGVCNVDVYGESNEGAKDTKIMPELAKINGKSAFVNFHYHTDYYDQNTKKQASFDDDLVTGLENDLKGYRDEIKSTKK